MLSAVYPRPWRAGIEIMITGFHERFNPQGIKNYNPKPFSIHRSSKNAVERLKLGKK